MPNILFSLFEYKDFDSKKPVQSFLKSHSLLVTFYLLNKPKLTKLKKSITYI